MTDYTDCFANRSTTLCKPLKEKICTTGVTCPFYKPRTQVDTTTIELDIHKYLQGVVYGKEQTNK